jgi:hypothetical protein
VKDLPATTGNCLTERESAEREQPGAAGADTSTPLARVTAVPTNFDGAKPAAIDDRPRRHLRSGIRARKTGAGSRRVRCRQFPPRRQSSGAANAALISFL